MTRLQALTLCRDAVQLTKGIYSGLWYDGPNRHCTIGALTQVAIDVGFPEAIGRQMMNDFKDQMGLQLKKRIIAITDGLNSTPQKRREQILLLLNNEIAKETEQVPVIPTPAEILSNTVLASKEENLALA